MSEPCDAEENNRVSKMEKVGSNSKSKDEDKKDQKITKAMESFTLKQGGEYLTKAVVLDWRQVRVRVISSFLSIRR